MSISPHENEGLASYDFTDADAFNQKITDADDMIEKMKAKLDDINALHERAEQYFSEQIDKATERSKNLFTEVEKLLPGATSSGLAVAYKDAKDTSELIARKWERLFLIIIFVLAIVPVAILYPNLTDIFKDGIVDFNVLIGRMAVILAIEFPMIWFGFMASKVGNQHRRISEEYRHKWAVASSFLGMRKQVEEIFEEEQSKLLLALLNNMIVTHAENPSHIIIDNKDYHHPFICLLERIHLASFLKSSGINSMDELICSVNNAVKNIFPTVALSTHDVKSVPDDNRETS